MAAFVVLTMFLRQRGSSESKKLRGREPVDADPRRAKNNVPPGLSDREGGSCASTSTPYPWP